ncbi:DUF2683 family protein [Mucilaginibacter sp. OK098]|uniref:DUF2683 family protein n=1 Tax=Mucilaginibacter sp. OK098 TaxID=1855297 RepID=UPI00091B2FDE|nr:DUF2683 family protein [Mucilaginibacter sp. OK098]SHN02422.1 hypothetical protein SAMN05216524_104633 [Mucilaginibacter sp. OK098]
MHFKSKTKLTAAVKVNSEKEGSPYNPDFVAKIMESKKQVGEGKYITLDPNKSIWENFNN